LSGVPPGNAEITEIIPETPDTPLPPPLPVGIFNALAANQTPATAGFAGNAESLWLHGVPFHPAQGALAAL